MVSKAYELWAALQPYRNERLRCKNYTYGRQYLDVITHENRRMTEEEYIRSEGNVPLKNNLIRRIVRNVLGVFRNNFRLPTAAELGLDPDRAEDKIKLDALERLARENNLAELYSRLMEEYLIGGMAVVRKSRIRRTDGLTVRTDIVRPDSFFFNVDATDPLGRDVTEVGEIHAVPLDIAIARFAESPEDAEVLESLLEPDGSNIRVVEYWRREMKRQWHCHDTLTAERYVSDRRPRARHIRAIWRSRPVWRYYFMASDGRILRQGDSPYPGGGHPYVMKAYPMIDGEIHSFVSDCIDQQRYINRLITLNDWILRASAKGVLLFPDLALPEDAEIQDIADQWARFNGVITYRHQDGVPLPQQISNNSANIGISELLSVQLKMMEDVSGVNAALQGQLSSGSMSGTLYDLQTRQSLTGLADILESFHAFMRDSALLDTRLLGSAR